MPSSPPKKIWRLSVGVPPLDNLDAQVVDDPGRADDRLLGNVVVAADRQKRINFEAVEADPNVGILQDVRREDGADLQERLRSAQGVEGLLKPREVDGRADWLASRLGARHLTALQLVGMDRHRDGSPLLAILVDAGPLGLSGDREELEPPAAFLPMHGALVLAGPNDPALRRVAEVSKVVVGALPGDAMAVVDDADGGDAAELVLNQLHPDLVSVRVQRVLDELRDALYRVADLGIPLEMVLPCLEG
jgi:hypothetical protein